MFSLIYNHKTLLPRHSSPVHIEPSRKFLVEIMSLSPLRPCSPRPVSPSELPGLDSNHLSSISISDPFSDTHAIDYSYGSSLKARSQRKSRWRTPSIQLPCCVFDGFLAFVEEMRRRFLGGGRGARGIGIRRGDDGMYQCIVLSVTAC